MAQMYLVTSSAGPNRDLSKDTREQAWWDDHALFVDSLVESGFMLMGGPLVDEGGAMIVVTADSESAVRDRLKDDPWYEHGILQLESIKRWEIFVDRLHC